MNRSNRLGDRDPMRAARPDEQSTVVLARDRAAAARARDWFTDGFGGQLGDAQAEDARLVISELVTNALLHGSGEIVVRAALRADGAVDLGVTDSAAGQPTMLPPDPTRVGGVGLRVVDALASSWGVARFPGGKTVWATIAPAGASPGQEVG